MIVFFWKTWILLFSWRPHLILVKRLIVKWLWTQRPHVRPHLTPHVRPHVNLTSYLPDFWLILLLLYLFKCIRVLFHRPFSCKLTHASTGGLTWGLRWGLTWGVTWGLEIHNHLIIRHLTKIRWGLRENNKFHVFQKKTITI